MQEMREPTKRKAVPAQNSYVSAAGAAELLLVSSKTISRWAKEGKLPHVKTLGGHRRYDVAQLRELAASLRFEAEEPSDG